MRYRIKRLRALRSYVWLYSKVLVTCRCMSCRNSNLGRLKRSHKRIKGYRGRVRYF